ncbi:hypothetical protein GCM10017576_02370 [Microbacterium barkeri]|uniref:Cardiolipin synthase N-terminal domain-containing protein n=1 Tax=Microbacterium barkeri TaxID=33917 RepID=A0A9W6H0N6_9MICO|nr:hypothetical protein GCM10017576_02370 [Microbacterium barkeri]
MHVPIATLGQVDPQLNPLIPAWTDIAWSSCVAAAVVLAILALVSIARMRRRAPGYGDLLWGALVVIVPVFGAIAWFVVGRRRHMLQR